MNFVKKVSYVLKSDTENVETSNASVVFQIIDLLSALVGSPPDLAVVKNLMEMALLLHETSQTFVAHSKSNFYYLLSSTDSSMPVSSATTWPRSRSFAGDFLRRAFTGDSRNGLLKHSTSHSALDESLTQTTQEEATVASPQPKHSSSDSDSMRMGEDYMFDSVNVCNDVTDVSNQSIDVERLKTTLAGLRNKRERSLLKGRNDAANIRCSKKEVYGRSGEKPLFERPGPWGLSVGEDEKDQGSLGDELAWCEGSHVIEGVLNILFNVMQNIPDSSLLKVVSEIILPEYILVLCNHDCSSVRNRSVRLLWQYISRSHKLEPHGYRLLKMEGYVLLANQLHQFEATEAVVDACLSIVHNRAVLLEECSEIPSHVQLNIRTPGLVPILALLPKSIDNVALAHGLILHIHELCAKVPGLLKNYKSIGLFESACKTLQALAQAEAYVSDVFGQDSREILFSDLHDLFRLISLRFVTARGAESFKSIEEFLLLLIYMAWTEQEALSNKLTEDQVSEIHPNDVVTSFRRAICVVLEECLTDIEARMVHIEIASGGINSRRSSDLGLYSGNIFPLEEVTDLLLRTVSPRGSVTGEEFVGGSGRRRRYWQNSSSSSSGSVTGRSVNFWSRNNENVKLCSKSEVMDRFCNIMEFAVDFITEYDPTCEPNGPDEAVENFMFAITASLMGELHSTLLAEKANIRPRTLFSSTRSLRTKLLTLINFSLFPEMPFRIRFRLLRLLNSHPGCSEVLGCLLHHHPDQHRLLICFIRRLVHDSRVDQPGTPIEDSDREDCTSFYSSLENWDLVEPSTVDGSKTRKRKQADDPSQSSSSDEISVLSTDDEIIRQFAAQLANHRSSFRRRCKSLIAKTVCQYDELTQQVSTKAVEVTKVAMKAQDEERKRFMVNIRDTLSEKVRAGQLWQNVIEGATHELGLWHFPEFYPQNWRLDEMEGAQRMRIRTERAFSDIGDRYYLPDRRPPTRKSTSMPFAYLLQAPSGMSGVIVAQLSSKDRIRHMDQCSLVLPSHEIAGEVLMSDHSIYFVENSTDETHTEGVLSITMKLADVREYHLRWWQLTDCAMELFLANGCTRFLVFADRHLRNNFAEQLAECQPRLTSAQPDLGNITRLWQDGILTNFDYLMQLNKLAGRTFNDLMQYPAFPFILADYTSPELDLTNPKSFRNLMKPISVQDPTKEDRYINNYEVLSQELSRSHELSCPGVGPFHYGSHYSNTGVVLHYLVRLPPFTSMFLKYQDGDFDLADRTFHSLGSAWELASGKSSSDVKELIPDLFYLPELLTNCEGFNFGHRQNGDRVDNVSLPTWAKNDPRLFIKIHRQALESDHVRETLNYWIDLVFGFKQSGPAAVEAINVFHPATYYGFDLNSISDPIQRKARATMIKTYGQTPKQLFKVPHPKIHKNALSSSPLKTRKGSRSSQGLGSNLIRALDNIIGLQWGSYVGAPSQPEPVIIYSRDQSTPVGKFIVGANNEVYGISSNASLIVKHDREGLITPFMSANVLGACLITWGHPDRHLRVRLRKNCPSEPLMPLACEDDFITTVNICTDAVFMWIGYASGKILAVRHTFQHKDLFLDLHPDQSDGLVSLFAHRNSVNEISPCLEFGVAVSASQDKTCIIWDLRKPSYVRKVNLDHPARMVTVCRASGDFAVISVPQEMSESYSILSLFTINGASIASRKVEPPVHSIAMSAAPEGATVNVIATGHRTTGVVRLWSTWDLSPVCDIDTKMPNSPIVAIAYSFDNQTLFAANDKGEIVTVGNSGNTNGARKPAKYLNLTEM